MTFSQSVSGGELVVGTFGDFTMPDAPADGVMHAELHADGFTVMGADSLQRTRRGVGQEPRARRLHER
ncbi:hypothetical protein [Microbacterium trichothecenolyticum]|uniref:Glyoxalase superfamily protein PhnB n=1 Tax=Microbacterium trichothecenolyticum TaxID=69370 RepID=A0ABU0TPC4_MICTR|nr:hypothetical protein [Microbacterium trichothecenolyticum]MDQ1121522.1 putative glyoxalase superfamily protein PhnB [Microbacterium trichothecenolyticum]